MMKDRTIFQVDAFTDEPFRGNPAGVMIAREGLSAEWMQSVAAEMNLSETAFVFPSGNDFQIRYFTPTKEVPLCGHATLASAHIVYELGLRAAHERVMFRAEGAELTAERDGKRIVMNFPRYPLQRMEVHGEFRRLVGFEPVEMYSSLYGWVVAVAAMEREIVNARPDFALLDENGLGHLMITSASDSGRADFVVRCFAPAGGIDEDPVTGSAHCALTPLWAGKLGKTEMESLQVSKRTGRLQVGLKGDRVEIRGEAVTVFEAKMKI
jgi:predicted PhzF superfamily epimerase YddE/YHI9